ncbi:MAG: nodulation protein NfeD [Balneolales bacterium]
MKGLILFIGASLMIISAELSEQQESSEREISVITVNGSIGPTTASYVSRAINQAELQGSVCLIFELDTPGGLLDSTTDIVQAMLASDVPVVVYVTPSGGGAISAGVFITLASHIAAMSPATNIGAATPVQMGGGEMGEDQREKLLNYSVSYIESIAARRDRNVEWAEAAVRDAASITEERALDINVVDIIAGDRQDLISQLHGWQVDGLTLETDGAAVNEIGKTHAEQFLGYLFNPQVMMILMIMAIYGIIGEISNPGAIVPGVIGVVALILLLYTVAAMPVNIAGFVLVALALILFVSEAFTPTFGLLTVAGAVTFFLGSLMLFEDLTPLYQVSLWYLLPATILTALFFGFIVSSGLKAQFGKVAKTGKESLIGKKVEALKRVGPEGGKVFVQGEIWNAFSEETVEKGERCEIIDIKGLTMKVRPVKNQEDQEGNHGR